MEIDVTISLENLWDGTQFQQAEWGHLNYFIGPNGTGKTRFAEQLKNSIREWDVRYLSADRLRGMESQDNNPFARTNLNQGFSLDREERYRRAGRQSGLSSDAYVELRDKPDLRTRVQAILSEFFGREIELEIQGGFLKPKMRERETSDRYDIRRDESHGLKELVSLLTLIHDDSHDIIILDEPELHLHPQYQRFLLNEIRKLSGDPSEDGSKAFFLITHSPSMVELRNINDLTNIYSFRSRSRPPHTVEEFNEDDEYHIKKLLPRLNTRHKEILFAKRPILVEGYTDEELYSLAIERHNGLSKDPESAIIGVGGKEDLDSFFRFCKNLGLEPRFIADLDILFEGNLRQTVSESEDVRRASQEAGLDSDLLSAIGEAKQYLTRFADTIESSSSSSEDPLLEELSEYLSGIDEPHRRQYVVLRAIECSSLDSVIDENDLRFVEGRIRTVIRILNESGFYVLSNGELEDYLRHEYSFKPLNSRAKSRLFNEARENLLESDSSDVVERQIGDLVDVLQSILSSQEFSIIEYLEEPISDWMHDVQWAVRNGQVSSQEELESHDSVGTEGYERLFEVINFEMNGSDDFRCKIQLTNSVDPSQRTLEFSIEDSPALIDLVD